MTRKVPHEITIMAFARNEDGTVSVMDVCETSRRYAPYFVRRFYRDPAVWAIGANGPNQPWNVCQPREIIR